MTGPSRDYAPALRRQGVTRAALFGSNARGETRPDSDIDILVKLNPEAPIDLFANAGIVLFDAVYAFSREQPRRVRDSVHSARLHG